MERAIKAGTYYTPSFIKKRGVIEMEEGADFKAVSVMIKINYHGEPCIRAAIKRPDRGVGGAPSISIEGVKGQEGNAWPASKFREIPEFFGYEKCRRIKELIGFEFEV